MLSRFGRMPTGIAITGTSRASAAAAACVGSNMAAAEREVKAPT